MFINGSETRCIAFPGPSACRVAARLLEVDVSLSCAPLSARTLYLAPGREALHDALEAALRQVRQASGMLSPLDLLVPHRALGEWLRRELSCRLGAVANLRCQTPAAWLRAQKRDAAGLQAALYAALDLEGLHDPAFAPLRAYLSRDGDDPGRVHVRRYELSRRIARIFRAYRAHTPGLLERADEFSGPIHDWQRALWQRCAAALSPAAHDASASAPLLPPPLFAFCIGVPGLDLIEALCAHVGPLSVFELAAPDTGSPWHRFGAARAHAAERWRTLPGLVERPLDDGSRRPSAPARFVRAASVRGACEAAAAQVWAWVRALPTPDASDPAGPAPPRFHEVGIALPAPLWDAWLPVLREAFEEAHGLPKVLWQRPVGEHNRALALALALLELPSTPMRRAEVVPILTHPFVTAPYSDDEPERWPDWLDAVGVFHGLDARDHAGTYLAGLPMADWDQGLSRLALGAFLGGERSGEPVAFAGPRGPLLAEEVAHSATSSLGTLLALTRSLLSDADFLRQASLPGAEWRDLLATYLVTYLRPAAPADLALRASILRTLSAAFERAELPGLLPWEVARAIALAALERVAPSGRIHLGQGLVIGTPAELAGVPFRRLIALGMQRGAYPAAPSQDELDLRADTPEVRPDDRWRRDTAAFYELIEAARGESCLIAVTRDEISGDSLEPSLLVDELCRQRARAGAPWHDIALPLHRRALHRSALHRSALHRSALHAPDRAESDEHAGSTESAGSTENAGSAPSAMQHPFAGAYAWALPESLVEQQARALGDAWHSAGRPELSREHLPEDWRAALGVPAMPPRTRAPEAVLEVPVSRLRNFLELGVRGFAEQRLAYRGQPEERAGLRDEPFEADALRGSGVLQEALYSALTREPAARATPEACAHVLSEAYAAATALRCARGTFPLGFFYDLQREHDLALLEQLLSTQARADERGPRPYRRLVWGQAHLGAQHDVLRIDPVELDVHELECHEPGLPRRVRLVGASHLLSLDGSALYRYQSSIALAPDRYLHAYWLRYGVPAWLDHLLLQASGRRARRRAQAQGNNACYGYTFGDLPPEQARAQLGHLVRDLLCETVDTHAPLVAILHLWEELQPGLPWRARERALAEEVLPQRKKPHDRYSAPYCPVARVETLPLPGEAQLDALCARLSAYVGEQLGERAARLASGEPDELAKGPSATALQKEAGAAHAQALCEAAGIDFHEEPAPRPAAPPAAPRKASKAAGTSSPKKASAKKSAADKAARTAALAPVEPSA